MSSFTIAKYAPEPLTDPIFLPSRSLTLLIVLLFFTISAFLVTNSSAMTRNGTPCAAPDDGGHCSTPRHVDASALEGCEHRRPGCELHVIRRQSVLFIKVLSARHIESVICAGQPPDVDRDWSVSLSKIKASNPCQRANEPASDCSAESFSSFFLPLCHQSRQHPLWSCRQRRYPDPNGVEDGVADCGARKNDIDFSSSFGTERAVWIRMFHNESDDFGNVERRRDRIFGEIEGDTAIRPCRRPGILAKSVINTHGRATLELPFE